MPWVMPSLSAGEAHSVLRYILLVRFAVADQLFFIEDSEFQKYIFVDNN